jgi:hypothetical protein
MITNRIRERRKQLGWSSDRLAAALGTTGATVRRLEIGETKLTVEWMQRLAKIMECSTSDLIASAILAGASDDVEPAEIEMQGLARAISQRGLTVYRVIGDSVSEAGVRLGDIITVDESAASLAALDTGDIVLVEFHDPYVLALRVYVKPGLLITNRQGTNLAVRTDDRSVRSVIRGVAVKG